MPSPASRRSRALGVFGLAAALLSAPAAARAQPEPIEETTVTAEALGPGLWRSVGTLGELFILGTVTPLPAGMAWRSARVDEIIARAERAIVGDVAVRLGPAEAAGAVFTRRDAVRNPDDATVSAQLTPALKSRFDAQRAALDLPADAFEHWRPYVAGAILLEKAFERAGLVNENGPQAESLKKLRRRGVKIERAVRIEGAAMLKRLNDMPLGADVACFEAELEMAEQAIPTLQARAQAWARGDVEALRTTLAARMDDRCLAALQAGGMPADQVEEQALQALTDAAARAAGAPGVTLMFAPMALLVSPDGVLARLARDGVAVEGP